jgi:acetate kinase
MTKAGAMREPAYLLAVNTGSSSLKLALFETDASGGACVTARVERIGTSDSRLTIAGTGVAVVLDERRDLRDHASALAACVDWLGRNRFEAIELVGHRVVYGGVRHRQPEAITPVLLADLRALTAIDPDHMPQAVATIEQMEHLYPGARAFACFDSGFHRTMPRVAQMYPLPWSFFDEGVVRYGFHGLSCEYIRDQLKTVAPTEAGGRVIVAHLGYGASMTAIADGTSVETTMGFSPTGGLAMGTRSGDLDPSVVLYLMNREHASADVVKGVVNRQSGLLGLSGTSGDMRDLLDREAVDTHAADAIASFCYSARKFLGSLIAVLGGLDTIVFTGGIGEHAASIRERICGGLGDLGIDLDAGRNARQEAVISSDLSRVVVRVMRTDEELMIARQVRWLLASEGAGHLPG